MPSLLLLPLFGMFASGSTACGDGVHTTVTPVVCIEEALPVTGGALTLGPATLTVHPAALSSASTVKLCRVELMSTGAVGPSFEVMGPKTFARDLVIEMAVPIPSSAKPMQVVAVAYYDTKNGPGTPWVKFNDNDHEYNQATGKVRGVVLMHGTPIVVGPVLTCSTGDECASRICNTGACQ